MDITRHSRDKFPFHMVYAAKTYVLGYKRQRGIKHERLDKWQTSLPFKKSKDIITNSGYRSAIQLLTFGLSKTYFWDLLLSAIPGNFG